MQTNLLKKWNFIIFVNNLTYRILSTYFFKITFLLNDINKYHFWHYNKNYQTKKTSYIKKLFKNFIWTL